MQIVIFLASTVFLLGGARLLSYSDLNQEVITTVNSENNILVLAQHEVEKKQMNSLLSHGHIGFYVLNEKPIFTASEFYSPSSYNLAISNKSPYTLSNFYQAKDYFNVDSTKAPQKVVIHKKIESPGV